MNRLHPLSRLLFALSVLTLVSAFFLPLWQIQLWAPQYPEGLNMKIWIDNLTGSFDIINGLNHYIGMAMIKLEMFPEFLYMKYVLGALIVLGVWCALRGTRGWLWIYVITLCLGALAGLVDFYLWSYDYGHNLDPNAAIQVPGMSYQPPLFGYKNLLNFTAYSGPDVGGWIMIAAGVLSGMILFWEQWMRTRRSLAKSTAPAAAIALTSLIGCNAEAEPFRYGRDECADCRMTISDQRFGAQIVTHKGRVLKFDDLCCLAEHVASGRITEADIRKRVVADFSKPNKLIPAEQALYLRHDALKSPMGSNTAAFSSEADRETAQKDLGGALPMTWDEARKQNP